ncbi:MAG: sulfite exporter TauE/SafE family protein [Candidatus Schekmanbacteria bacterium]|nr:sulfite exporter TauE/SafE family protein [Candidatus Schekmanbacteria bacterium]
MTAVCLAAFLGSAHCVGMCGPFAGLAVGSARAGRGGSGGGGAARIAAYQAGRLAAYVSLGVTAGWLGSSFLGFLGDFARWAAVALGTVMIAVGAGMLVGVGRGSPPWWRGRLLAGGFGAAVAGVARRVRAWPSLLRAAAIGSSSGLLPCGWLYGFVAVAAATAGPLRGGETLFAFWLGSAPALVGLGAGLTRVLARFSRYRRVASGALLITAGLVAIAMRAHLGSPTCH